MKNLVNRTGLYTLFIIGVVMLLSACSDEKIAVDVVGYNHMSPATGWSIAGFTVNGGGGPNVRPEEGGGGHSCCVNIPEHWKPGMKATVKWAYNQTRTNNQPPPPQQEATVEIPEYTPENLGDLQVHFYPNHRIKVVVSRYSLGHPLYPLPKEDWAPWTLNEGWAKTYERLQQEQIK